MIDKLILWWRDKIVAHLFHNWTCGNCEKSFSHEHKLDKHMEKRHGMRKLNE